VQEKLLDFAKLREIFRTKLCAEVNLEARKLSGSDGKIGKNEN
jgi:hypothetical protein